MEFYKIAFFVEGYTEQEFLKRLLVEVFGEKKIGIEIKEIKGGSRSRISYTSIETPTLTTDTLYYILIYNCGGDSSIKSYILDRRVNLIRAGYKKIVGLRDVYPDFTRAEISTLISRLQYRIPQREIPISFILSVMEIESWFIAEENHYSSIDVRLTIEDIVKNFSFNPKIDNSELIDEPAKMLKDIYSTVGKTYKKDKRVINRTVQSLDYSNLYFNVNERILSFKNLVDEINLIFQN